VPPRGAEGRRWPALIRPSFGPIASIRLREGLSSWTSPQAFPSQAGSESRPLRLAGSIGFGRRLRPGREGCAPPPLRRLWRSLPSAPERQTIAGNDPGYPGSVSSARSQPCSRERCWLPETAGLAGHLLTIPYTKRVQHGTHRGGRSPDRCSRHIEHSDRRGGLRIGAARLHARPTRHCVAHRRSGGAHCLTVADCQRQQGSSSSHSRRSGRNDWWLVVAD
jgi:hypothetical protein